MKAEFSNVLVFFVIFFIGVYVLSVIFNAQAYASHGQKTVLETEEFSLQKSLEAAKLYAETSLRYSFYQACYNVSLNSGWPPSSTGASAVADAATFKAALEAETTKTMATYSEGVYIFLGSFEVKFPTYDAIIIKDEGNGVINVTVKAKDMFLVHRELDTKKVTLEKNAAISVNITSPCFSLHKKALERSVAISSMDNMKGELERWPVEASVELGHTFTKDNNDAFYAIMTAEYPELIRGKFEEASALKDGEAILAAQALAASSVKPSAKAVITTSCTGYTFVEDGQTKSKRECKFSYSVSVTSSSPLTEQSLETYPVFNGETVAFEPVKFVFTSGKVYERKPTPAK